MAFREAASLAAGTTAAGGFGDVAAARPADEAPAPPAETVAPTALTPIPGALAALPGAAEKKSPANSAGTDINATSAYRRLAAHFFIPCIRFPFAGLLTGWRQRPPAPDVMSDLRHA